jgi:hypothetical protein
VRYTRQCNIPLPAYCSQTVTLTDMTLTQCEAINRLFCQLPCQNSRPSLALPVISAMTYSQWGRMNLRAKRLETPYPTSDMGSSTDPEPKPDVEPDRDKPAKPDQDPQSKPEPGHSMK